MLIERAGDVIPKVIKVLGSAVRENHFHPPKKCPECGGEIIKETSEAVAYRCINPSCPKQLEKKLIHFASRLAMDIEGFGEAVVVELLKRKLVKDLADIYFLKKEDFLQLPLFKDKKAGNLLAGIERSKKQPLSRLLFALGITNIGEKAAYTIAQRFGSIENILKAKREDFEDIHEIGTVMAESLAKFFEQAATKKLLEKFKRVGIKLVEPKAQTANGKLKGKSFIFTGELADLSRIGASAMVKRLGGEIHSSVSKNTDFIVVGENPGSKYQKAQQLGLKIINQSEFERLVKEQEKK